MTLLLLIGGVILFIRFATDAGAPAKEQQGWHVPLITGIVILLFFLLFPGYMNAVGGMFMAAFGHLLGGR